MRLLLSICLLIPLSLAACHLSNRPAFSAGSEAYLKGDSEAVPVAVDLDSLTRLKQSVQANNEGGMRELISDNRILAVPHNTKVIVLEAHDDTAYKVRILEGDFAQRVGWVYMIWLSPEKVWWSSSE